MASGPALCDGCRARITFVTVHKQGGGTGRMVLDERPNPEGNVAVRTSGQAKVGRVLGKNGRPDTDEVLYMPHWATCPNPPKRKREQPLAKPAPPAPAAPATLFDPT